MNVTPSGLFAAAADSGFDPGQFTRSDRSDRNVVAAQPDSIGSSLDRPKTDALAQIAFVPPELWQNLNLATSYGTTAAAGPKSGRRYVARRQGTRDGQKWHRKRGERRRRRRWDVPQRPEERSNACGGHRNAVGRSSGGQVLMSVSMPRSVSSARPCMHQQGPSTAKIFRRRWVTSKTTSAKSVARRPKPISTKRLTTFAGFVKTGGKEAAEAIGVVAGAAGAPSKLLGLAEKAKALGGVEGIIAAGSKGAKNVGEALTRRRWRCSRRNCRCWQVARRSRRQRRFEPTSRHFALPGGGAVRESELGHAGIYESRAQNVNAGTCRNLHSHETAGGHTIDRHVGKSDAELQKRLVMSPNLPAASTFSSESTAEIAQNTFMSKNAAIIENWLAKSKSDKLVLTDDVNKPIGRVVTRGESEAQTTTKATFVLKRDSSEQKWHFLTIYPVK